MDQGGDSDYDAHQTSSCTTPGLGGATLRRTIEFIAAIFVVLSASGVAARPMVVAVFEASAYAEPRNDADVVAIVIEGTELSAAEQADNGWRKVRLATGDVAWMHDDELRPRRTPATVLRRDEPPPPKAQHDSVQAQIYVTDLDHLASLVQDDPVVYPMARELTSDSDTADILTWGGLGIGAAMTITGLVVFEQSVHEYDPRIQHGEYRDQPENTIGAVVALTGATMMLVGVIAGAATNPGRRDLLNVVNSWNKRHPDQPFTLDRL